MNYRPVREVEQRGEKVIVRCEVGENEVKEICGDFLIGADGNTSIVRKYFLKTLGEERECLSEYTGIYDLVANVPMEFSTE